MDSTVAALAVSAGVIGLMIGSFLNVVIHRVPLGQSIVTPGSRCPECEEPIRPVDNVPVLSWILLKGRCRNCATSIAGRYPFVEALTAVLFASVALRFGVDEAAPAYLLFVAVAVAISAIDLEHRRIPTVLVWPTLAVSAVWLVGVAVVREDLRSVVEGVLGAVAGGAPLFLAWAARPGAMGFGDVRFATYLGFVLGWLHLGLVPLGLFLAFASGSVVGIALMVFAGRGGKAAIPFGPFLAFGALVAVLLGRPMLSWYVEMFGV